MKVKLLQSGGGIPAFGYYRPVTVTQPSGTSTTETSSTSKSNGLGEKDYLSIIDKLDALPSDMASLKTLLTTTFSPNSFSMFGDNLNTGMLDNQFVSTLLAIKNANYSKKQFEEVKKNLTSNGGLNELAITNQGGIVVSDEDGNIDQISVDEYLANKGQYQAITNSKLLQMREQNVNYANNNEMVEIASNGIGLGEIHKQIRAYLGSLGTSTNDRESYQVLQGAEALKKVYEETGQVKPEGLYKTKVLTTDQKKQAQLALGYIWNMLPENMKTLLKVKGGGTSGAQELIASFVASGLTDKTTYSETYILDKNGDKPGSKGSSSSSEGDKSYKPGPATMFLEGRGQETEFVIQNGTADGIKVRSNMVQLTDNNKKAIGPTTIYNLESSGFSGILDFQNVSMGGQKISEAQLTKVACTDGKVYSIDFPIDLTEYERGNIVPDFKMFAAKEKADQQIKSLGITDPEEINKIYQQNGVPAKYNSDGTLRSEKWQRFAVMNGVAIGSAFDEDVTFSDMLPEVDDRELDGYLHIFNHNAGISGSQETIKEKSIKFDKESMWDKIAGFGGQHWWSTHDTMHKGTIFIPVHENQINAIIGDGSEPAVGTLQTIDEAQQDYELQNSFNDEGLL